MTDFPPGDNGPLPGNTALGPGGDDFTTGLVTAGDPAIIATLGEWIDYLLTLTPPSHDTSANFVFAGPVSGGAGPATFRYLVADDVPRVLNTSTIGGNFKVQGGDFAVVGGDGSFTGSLAVQNTLSAGGAVHFTAGGTIDSTTTLDSVIVTSGITADNGHFANGVTITTGGILVGGLVNADTIEIGGNKVLSYAQQGTITVYDHLVFGSGTTLDAGGTITAGSAGALLAANNLSDVSDAALSRKNINQGVGTLVTSGATISTDASLGNVFQASLTNGVGPYVLANPTNLLNGSSLVWYIDQPGTATTMTYGSKFLFALPYTNASPPPLSVVASGKSVLTGMVDSSGNIRSSLVTDFA